MSPSRIAEEEKDGRSLCLLGPCCAGFTGADMLDGAAKKGRVNSKQSVSSGGTVWGDESEILSVGCRRLQGR